MTVGSKPEQRRSDFEDVWKNLPRKVHLFYLSQPKHQAIRPYPDPDVFVEVPRPITKAALNYNPTDRINLMSAPVKSKMTPKYQKPVAKENVVEPAALLAVATPRLIELAKPVTRDVSSKKKSAKKKTKKVKKSKKSKMSQEQREAWIVKNAAPKKWPPPQHAHPRKLRFVVHGNKKIIIKEKRRFTLPKRPQLTISKADLFTRCVELSIPARRREKFRWTVERDDFFERREKKITSPVSDVIKNLALPKRIPSEALLDLKYKPFKIKKGALRYKATDRIITLAKPMEKREKKVSDVKENPFGVVKRALKAICTKRVAELAQPIRRE